MVALCLVTSTPISFAGRKEELESRGSFFPFVFFSFFAKGLLPVSELRLLPPKLSLQSQCTDGLRGCVYMCARTCVCILGRGVYF